jgi:hypothetical protein
MVAMLRSLWRRLPIGDIGNPGIRKWVKIRKMANWRLDHPESDDHFRIHGQKDGAGGKAAGRACRQRSVDRKSQRKASYCGGRFPPAACSAKCRGIGPKALAEQAFRLLVSIRRAGFL